MSYVLKHRNGGYVNKEGGEPCCICADTLIVDDIELESQGGTVISPRVTVTFPSDCTKNLALVNFIQVRER